MPGSKIVPDIAPISELPAHSTPPVTLFLSYSGEDKRLVDELIDHLKILQRTGTIDIWYDRMIPAGEIVEKAIDERLGNSDIILLCVSPSYIASEYCYDTEVRRALDLHETNRASVIPIILKTVLWENAPFAKLAALPTDRRPIATFRDRGQAFINISSGIRDVALGLRQRRAADMHGCRYDGSLISEHPTDDSSNVVLGSITILTDLEKLGIDGINKILEILKESTDDPHIEIRRIRRGSTILDFECSSATLAKLQALFTSGQLEERIGIALKGAIRISTVASEATAQPQRSRRDRSTNISPTEGGTFRFSSGNREPISPVVGHELSDWSLTLDADVLEQISHGRKPVLVAMIRLLLDEHLAGRRLRLGQISRIRKRGLVGNIYTVDATVIAPDNAKNNKGSFAVNPDRSEVIVLR